MLIDKIKEFEGKVKGIDIKAVWNTSIMVVKLNALAETI